MKRQSQTPKCDKIDFSFEDNIVLDEKGRRVLPDKDNEAEVRHAVSMAFFIEFKSARQRGIFEALSKVVGCKFNHQTLSSYPSDILKFAWYPPLKQFISLDSLSKFIETANKYLDTQHKTN